MRENYEQPLWRVVFKQEQGVSCYRYLLRGKMYAYIGIDDRNGRPIITLKLEPMFGDMLRQEYEDIVPGYYTNKLHWCTIYLDGNVPQDVLTDIVYACYRLVQSSLSKGEILMDAIIFQKLDKNFLHKDALDNFNRYQIVKRCWRKQDKEWVLTDNPFIEDWNTEQKRNIISELTSCISNDGVVYGAISDNKLVGFVSVTADFFGKCGDYVEMPIIQVSADYRHKGIGRNLFELIADSARLLGAKRIYISAHSSEESQAFYKAIGCIDAVEINTTIAENEPFDCQMEYVL